MKKILMLLASALILSGTACAIDNLESSETSSNLSANGKASGNAKVLVAYYSDTGTTKSVAEKIASYLNTDLLKIESVNPYSRSDLNWNDKTSRVVKEHDAIFGSKGNGQASAEDFKNAASQVSTEIDSKSVIDLSAYDVVFIGYPIWWGMAAWPVNGFVTQNNFSGKTVVPFATSMSSNLGQSDKVLHDVAGSNNGNWISGHRFGTRASDSEVHSWVDGLKL